MAKDQGRFRKLSKADVHFWGGLKPFCNPKHFIKVHFGITKTHYDRNIHEIGCPIDYTAIRSHPFVYLGVSAPIHP